MDSRTTRRDARLAADQLMAGRKETAADLATSNNNRLAAQDAMTGAQARLAGAEDQYRQTRARALDSGWTNAELLRLGYPPARQRRRSLGSASEGAGQNDETATSVQDQASEVDEDGVGDVAAGAGT